MPKAVLLSVQPYYVFLIIAKAMGWNIDIAKTVEVRKNYPKADDWDKTVKIYCSKDKRSFARIPKEYQALMKPLLGKVIGEFVCSNIAKGTSQLGSCLSMREISEYANGKEIYGWHISDLVIYDKPKELSEFQQCHKCKHNCVRTSQNIDLCKYHRLKRPPQSWCYLMG